MTKRGVHDLGGLPGGPVDRHEHAPTLTERRIDAMMMLLRDDNRRFFTTDENRRTIESMTPDKYEGSSYYERWVRSLSSLMVEKGVLGADELAARLADVQARYPRRNLATGQRAENTSAKSAPAKSKGASKKPATKGGSKAKTDDPFSAPGKTRAGARVKGEGGGA